MENTDGRMEQIDNADYAKRDVVKNDLLGRGNGGREHRIVSELNGRSVGCEPVVGMSKRFVKPEAGGEKKALSPHPAYTAGDGAGQPVVTDPPRPGSVVLAISRAGIPS